MNLPADGRLTSREYLSLPAAGSPPECDSTQQRASDRLRLWLSRAVIEGFLVRTLSTPADIVDEDLSDFDILGVAGGRLPVVWLNVTYYPGRFDPRERETFEDTFGLYLLCETESLD
jgi:hypothetical protein